MLIPDLGSTLIPLTGDTPRTTWGNGLPTMPTAAYLVAEGISPTTGPGREGKGKTLWCLSPCVDPWCVQ